MEYILQEEKCFAFNGMIYNSYWYIAVSIGTEQAVSQWDLRTSSGNNYHIKRAILQARDAVGAFVDIPGSEIEFPTSGSLAVNSSLFAAVSASEL